MNPDNIVLRAAAWIVPLVIAIVFHEVAHGWAARWLGDPTARDLRRLSFNPIRHVDPVGTVLLPLGLAVAGAPVFGWAKPVPVDASRLRNPRWGMVLVALAGPGMNFALALLAAIAIGVVGSVATGPVGAFLTANLFNFILVNVFLALFNLLPVPPLDGSHVLEGVLPRPLAMQYAKLARYGLLIVILLIVVVPMVFPNANLIGRIVVPPAQAVVEALLRLASSI
ncbi:Zn-dependent protease [Sphingomonas jinjuensis]|uniref:Zn-dependent protease n=1 Tax=Sphingomonas jinjuensis TaxID=535907 RepID=A0A840FB45_9SPHN|nr:site-2 protease family protein [Sphingomonas jinjuensis]MBB4153871.1 Zn-dependent protease [Sphingomonas jinjuensis]